MLPGMRDFIEGAGQIVWVDSSGKGGGLRFIDVPEGTQRVIKEWVDSENESHFSHENDAYPAIETGHSRFSSASPRRVEWDSQPGGTNRNLFEQVPNGSVTRGAPISLDSDRAFGVSGRIVRARTKALTVLWMW
jgi:hypothetical protein